MMLVIGVIDGYCQIIVVIVDIGWQLVVDEMVDIVVYVVDFVFGFEEIDYWLVVVGQWVKVVVVMWVGQVVYVEDEVGIEWQVVFEVEGFEGECQVLVGFGFDELVNLFVQFIWFYVVCIDVMFEVGNWFEQFLFVVDGFFQCFVVGCQWMVLV